LRHGALGADAPSREPPPRTPLADLSAERNTMELAGISRRPKRVTTGDEPRSPYRGDPDRTQGPPEIIP